jgi:hypothetical protein
LDDDDEYEHYDSRVSWEPPPVAGGRLKPVAITIGVLAVIAIVAVVLLRDKFSGVKDFDSAPVLQQGPDEEGVEAPPLVATGKEEPQPAEPQPAEPQPEEPQPEEPQPEEPQPEEPRPEEPQPEEPQPEEPQPEEPQPEEPAVAPTEPAPPAGADALAQYEDLLKQAKRVGRRKKIELLEEAIAINPNGDAALAELGTQLMEGGKDKRESAMGYAQRAVEANPDNGQAWLVIGYIHQLSGDRAASKEAYRKCAACSGPGMYVRECRRLAR